MAIFGFLCLFIIGIFCMGWGIMTNWYLRLLTGKWFWPGVAAFLIGVVSVVVAVMNSPISIKIIT